MGTLRQPTVYIMTNKRHGTLYTGVTSNPSLRISQHKAGSEPGFTRRYGCNSLVYTEHFEHMEDAIRREKQIKAGSRQDKIALIEAANPEWREIFI